MPKILGRRELENKWNKYLMAIFSISIILFVIDMLIFFLQSEAQKIKQLF